MVNYKLSFLVQEFLFYGDLILIKKLFVIATSNDAYSPDLPLVIFVLRIHRLVINSGAIFCFMALLITEQVSFFLQH